MRSDIRILDALPRDEGMVYNFFRPEDDSANILYLLDRFVTAPAARSGFRRNTDYDIPWMVLYDLHPIGDPDAVIGYVFRTHPRASARVTSKFVHIGNPGGHYERRFGLPGVQVYSGDDDTLLVSLDARDTYTAKIEADIIS